MIGIQISLKMILNMLV